MLAALVLNWNNFEDTENCLSKLLNPGHGQVRVILLDNASTDGSYEKLVKLFEDQVVFLRNMENLGFGAGMNRGIQWAYENDFEYVVLINNDALIKSLDLVNLALAAESNPNFAIAAPQIVSTYDSTYLWGQGSKLNVWLMSLTNVREDTAGNSTIEVEFVSGCVMLLKLKLQSSPFYFDTDFFMYFEDTELCSRVRRRGFSIAYIPSISCQHRIKPGITDRVNPFVFYHLGAGRIMWLRKSFHGIPRWYGFLTHFVFFTPYRLLQGFKVPGGGAAFWAWIRGSWSGFSRRKSSGPVGDQLG